MSDYFLADDLSGALDAAAAFDYAGRRVRIALSLQAWSGAKTDDVVGVTTETRNAPARFAADVVTKTIAHGRGFGARLLFKKIDSTMRGPVAAELAALAAAMPEARLLFTPANPRVGRTVRDGVLRVHGVPVAETEFGQDPVSPVIKSSLRELLGSAATARVTIVDAIGDGDLERAVAGIAAGDAPWVAVGSGALAGPVAMCHAMVRARAQSVPSVPREPMLAICGSSHPANRAQASRLARECNVPLHELRVVDPTSAAAEVSRSLHQRGAAAVSLEREQADSGAALKAIATIAASAIGEAAVRRIFVTGGETAFAVCRALKIESLHFLEEIEPGLSLSCGDAAHGPMLVAVKPGGFGDDATWVRAWQRLRA